MRPGLHLHYRAAAGDFVSAATAAIRHPQGVELGRREAPPGTAPPAVKAILNAAGPAL